MPMKLVWWSYKWNYYTWIMQFLFYRSGAIPKRSEGIGFRQPDTWSSEDSWRVHTGVRFPDRRQEIEMGEPQRIIQHDRDLPSDFLNHDQGQWGCHPLGQRLHRPEKNPAKERGSEYDGCARSPLPLAFASDLRGNRN